MPPEIDLVDSTWIDTRPGTLGTVIADPANWPRWWPDLDLAVQQLRGARGVRWTVLSADVGHHQRLSGSMEIWIEDVGAGVVAHYFLRLGDSARPRLSRRRRGRVVRAYRTGIKHVLWAVADELDPGRLGRVAAPTRPPSAAR
jgi:hypothetical protein